MDLNGRGDLLGVPVVDINGTGDLLKSFSCIS